MRKIPVYSVTAYSGTGKTTLLEKLIPELKKHGLRVAVLKHDAHDFEIDKEGKDSRRMTDAGADISAVTSASKTAIIETGYIPAEEIIAGFKKVDIVLTEGYKHEAWPKIALFRKEAGEPLSVEPGECFAIMTDTPIETDRPCLDINDAGGLALMLIDDIKGNYS